VPSARAAPCGAPSRSPRRGSGRRARAQRAGHVVADGGDGEPELASDVLRRLALGDHRQDLELACSQDRPRARRRQDRDLPGAGPGRQLVLDRRSVARRLGEQCEAVRRLLQRGEHAARQPPFADAAAVRITRGARLTELDPQALGVLDRLPRAPAGVEHGVARPRGRALRAHSRVERATDLEGHVLQVASVQLTRRPAGRLLRGSCDLDVHVRYLLRTGRESPGQREMQEA
jgi:hypothetical protein